MSLFITFEGPDGSGKSTQIKLLSEALTAAGHDVLTVREPGGTPISEQIRDVVHNLRNREMSDHAECLLYNAARAQLVDQLILPHLRQRGGIVLSDRYADSTLAYQGYGRGLDLSAVRNVIAFATHNLQPDVTFYLDIPVEEGIERRKQGGEWNRLDDQAVEFHRRVRAGYLQMMREEPQRWVRIEAARSVEEIQADIRAEVERKLKSAIVR